MKAVFRQTGTLPVSIERLHIKARNGATSPEHDFSSHIGTGSSEHCLDGAASMSLTTDAQSTGANSAIEPCANTMQDGGGASLVAARMSLTFLAKASAKV